MELFEKSMELCEKSMELFEESTQQLLAAMEQRPASTISRSDPSNESPAALRSGKNHWTHRLLRRVFGQTHGARG
jgi:hypothetical protein